MIRLIADTIFSEENPNVLPCDRGTFVKLLHIASTGMFLYKDKLFQQPWDRRWIQHLLIFSWQKRRKRSWALLL